MSIYFSIKLWLNIANVSPISRFLLMNDMRNSKFCCTSLTNELCLKQLVENKSSFYITNQETVTLVCFLCDHSCWSMLLQDNTVHNVCSSEYRCLIIYIICSDLIIFNKVCRVNKDLSNRPNSNLIRTAYFFGKSINFDCPWTRQGSNGIPMRILRFLDRMNWAAAINLKTWTSSNFRNEIALIDKYPMNR